MRFPHTGHVQTRLIVLITSQDLRAVYILGLRGPRRIIVSLITALATDLRSFALGAKGEEMLQVEMEQQGLRLMH